MENLNFLACQNDWSCQHHHRPVAAAHIRDGVRHLDVNCDHARSFEPRGALLRVHTSKKIECQWRLLIINVVDFEKAGIPLGFYIKAYSVECHKTNHHLVMSQTPMEFKETKSLSTADFIPENSAESVKALDKLFWVDASYLYYMGYTESQAFIKLRSQSKYDIILQMQNLNPTKLYSKLRYQFDEVNQAEKSFLDYAPAIQLLESLEEPDSGPRKHAIIYHEGDSDKINIILFCTNREMSRYVFSPFVRFIIAANNIFFVRARKLSCRLVVFDTTHDTNACGLYLALFVVMNEYGMCETVGKALISHQDASTFSRLFEAWKNMLQLTDPILFMTDGDAAIASAVAETLPFSNHILCTWHIIVQNGTTHLCKIMSNMNFDTVSGMLWDICLKEDNLDEQIIIQVYLKKRFYYY
jgi:hypothetical protein